MSQMDGSVLFLNPTFQLMKEFLMKKGLLVPFCWPAWCSLAADKEEKVEDRITQSATVFQGNPRHADGIPKDCSTIVLRRDFSIGKKAALLWAAAMGED